MQRNKVEILRILASNGGVVPTTELKQVLNAKGIVISERNIRLYLTALAENGFIYREGRRGCRITDLGRQDLLSVHVVRRLGYLSSKIDQVTFKMDFNLVTRTGEIIINQILVKPQQLLPFIDQIKFLFKNGFGMGGLLSLDREKSRVGNIIVPRGMVMLGTVCSMTINGVFLKHGIPVHSRFAGLLNIEDGNPKHFVEIIDYEGTSIDPLDLFIRARLTDYRGLIQTGNGIVGASFREIPAGSREQVVLLSEKLDRIGLGGIVMIGYPEQDLLNIPVNEGRCGIIVMGGVNPLGILEEVGVQTESRVLSSLREFQELFSYTQLSTRLDEIVNPY